MRKADAEFQIKKQNSEAILKEKEANGRSKCLTDPGRNRDEVHHHDHRNAASSFETDRLKELMSQLLKSAQALDEKLEEKLKKMDCRPLRQRDHPSYEVSHSKSVLLPQAILEAPMLPSLLIKQSETKLVKVIAPAPRVQDPVKGSEDVREVSVQQVQELQKSVAAQVFEKMPQPTTQTVEGEGGGTKSQKPEAVQFNQSAKVLRIQNIHKVSELGIKFLIDDDRLESSLSLQLNLQDDIVVFPLTDSEGSSYYVEDSYELKTHHVAMIVLPCSQ